MTKYINEETLRKLMYEEAFEKDSDMQKWDSGCWIRYKLFENCLEAVPAEDVTEIKHGRWIQKGRKIYCSKCNRGVYIGTDDDGLMKDEMRLRHFCSACGAKMDGGEDE